MVPPVYLHFLDRELNQSVGTLLTSDQLLDALKVLAISNPADFYCGVSLVLEHPNIDRRVRSVIETLVASDQLGLVSHHDHPAEFVASRRQLYQHDRHRYESYFDSEPMSFHPTDFKDESTTQTLAASLTESLEDPDSGLSVDTKGIVDAVLASRTDEAITSALFTPQIPEGDSRTLLTIAATISTQYTKHYLAVYGGQLATGVPGLSRYDGLSSTFPSADIPVCKFVLEKLGLGPFLANELADSDLEWDRLLGDRESRLQLARPVSAIVRVAAVLSGSTVPGRSSRMRLAAIVRGWFDRARRPDGPRTATRSTAEATIIANEILAQIERDHPWLRAVIDPSNADTTIVVTATAIEAEAVQVAMTDAGKTIRHQVGPGVPSHYEIGPWPSTRLIWVRCRPGSGTRGGSQDVVRDSISAFKPSRVIMVGIAFGVDENAQPIGSILVADQVVNYDLVRYGTNPEDATKELVRDRSEVGPANIGLVEAFRDMDVHSPERTQVGLVLSGPELVDNVRRRDRLVAEHVGAIGGEMEGYGIHVACHRPGIPWVLVKGVCDWGDGAKGVDKDNRQRVAARASVMRLVTYLGVR